ncbi:MAG: HAD-IA family hydrolase [Streptomyces sp.]|nr:HAD-IA family hydrolase [Streptomyces sp.]
MATETEELSGLITGARFVLFDFDGPICRLFAGHPAPGIARDLVTGLKRRGLLRLLTETEKEHSDPQAVLLAVDERQPGGDLVAELEEMLTQQELRAVRSAQPTPYADQLIRTWTALGARLAVTTNNSARAVSRYLAGRGLLDCFAPHIYGRTHELHQQKPDPYRLNRALKAMGAAAGAALMIGDTPSDLRAAERAGVPFLGYACGDERKEKFLREAGATVVVGSLEPVLRLLPEQA